MEHVCPGADAVISTPPFQSYHIHILYWPDAESLHDAPGALRLRKAFIDHFDLQYEPNCTGLTGQGRLCMIPLDEKPGFGFSHPFPVPNWAAYVPLERFADTVPWIMQNRGVYDILVHPNSGCMLNDPRNWAVWGGSKWELMLEPRSQSTRVVV
jgi:aromatic ring-cleaving dioxygenase